MPLQTLSVQSLPVLPFPTIPDPPSSNRGGTPGKTNSALNPESLPLDFALDWVALTLPSERHTDFWVVASKYFPLELSAKNPFPTRGYKQVTEFQDGPRVSQSDGRPEIHVQFSGKVLQMLSFGEQVSLLRELLEIGGSPTRIDARFDDSRKIVVPANLVEWSNQGFLCRFRTWQPIEKFRNTQSLGLTFTAGRRGQNGSGLYMRVYEWYHGPNGAKHNGRNKDGEFDVVRFEAELTSYKAVQFAKSLASKGTIDGYASEIFNCICGSIDFRSGDKSASFRDRKRLPEWDSYVQQAPQYKYVKPDRVKPTGFPIAAFILQWGGKLAQFCQTAGSNAFGRVLRDSIHDGQRRGYGVSVPFEQVVSTVQRNVDVLSNLSHTRRQHAFQLSAT